MERELLLVGVLGIAGYFFLTKMLPDLLKNLGKSAGDTAAGAATGIAQGAGTAAGGIIMAAPNAINALVEYVTGYPNVIGSIGEAISAGIFRLANPGAEGESLFYSVTFLDKTRHAIASGNVNSRGQFTYSGRTWQMLIGQDQQRYAAPVS